MCAVLRARHIIPCPAPALACLQLLAGMGYRGAGHGLGRRQHGIEHALQARRLKPGAGLGVDSGKGIEEGEAVGLASRAACVLFPCNWAGFLLHRPLHAICCRRPAASRGMPHIPTPAGKRKHKSGKQRRRDKAARERAEQREAAQQAQQELERRTGNEGLFAVLDSLIGDSSQAQQAKDASLGLHGGRGSASAGGGSGVGGTSRQGHLFGGSAAEGGGSGNKKPAAKVGGAASWAGHTEFVQACTATWCCRGNCSNTPSLDAQHGSLRGHHSIHMMRSHPPPTRVQEEDRRALAQRGDALAQLRLKVKRLEEMQGRNKRDKVMLPQIERALREARAQLGAAEAQHAASTKAISDKEKLRKMVRQARGLLGLCSSLSPLRAPHAAEP